MMNRFFIIMTLLLGVNVAIGQGKYADDKNEAAPKTALAEVQKEYQRAIKEKNFPLLMQSLIRQIKYQSLIDMDSVPPMLTRLEEYIPTNQNIVERSILHSLMAELYNMYYQSVSSKLYNRTPITGYIPKNMKEWTGNIYIEKIFKHALDAVAAQEQLAKINCLEYKDILILGKNSPALRPTLFDFLTYRSIDILDKLYSALQYFKQTPLTNDKLLGSVEEFIQLPIETPLGDTKPNITKSYQRLLQSQVIAKRSDALIVSDLDRLQFMNQNLNIPDKDSLYRISLERLNRKYDSNPYSVEILNQLAQSYYNGRFYRMPDTRELTQDYKKALEICNNGIQKFPGYFRINILKEQVRNITQPEANFGITENVYPGKTQNIQLNYRNLSNFTVTLYRIKESTLDYLNSNKNNLTKERVYTQTYKFTDTPVVKDTVLQIPVPTTGLYELSVSSAKQTEKMEPLYFSSSRLSAFARKTGDKSYNILVCDLLSGKPIKDAKVKIYQHDNDPKYTLLTEVTSDANGIVTINKLDNNRLFQVTLGDDNQGVVNRLPYAYFNRPQNESNQVNLFTDRAIYRPGQTVYFNGICWMANSDGAEAIHGKKYTVTLLDANNQQISKKEFTTNQFGSFTGSFVLPQDVLNGIFTLTTENTSHVITIAEYKRPKFKISFNPLTEGYKLGDKITVSGDIKSYSGVNLENCKISYSILENTFGWWPGTGTPMQTGNIQSDAKGKFEISLNTPKEPIVNNTLYPRAATINYLINVSVTSPNGETQESQYTINVNNQRYFLYALLTPEMNKNTLAKIPVTAQNNNGYKLTENITYTLSLLKPLKTIGSAYDLQNPPIDKKVLEGKFTTGETSSLELDLASYASGAYLLSLQGTGADQKITYQQIVYLYSLQDKRPPLLTYNWLVEEKTNCTPGEDAKILLGSSAKEVYALYEVYSDRQLMERKRVVLNDANVTLSIPYQKTFGTTADVVISYVKDNQFFTNTVMLTRKEESKQLDIITKTFRDHLIPGQQEEWSFIIKNAQDKPVIAEMMATMYDASLDQFSRNEWYFNPVYRSASYTPRWFLSGYPQRGYLNFYSRNSIEIAPFDFDKLNLYGLRLFSFSQLFEGRIRGLTSFKKESGQQNMQVAERDEVRFGNSEADLTLSENAAVSPPKQLSQEVLPEQQLQIRQNFQETAFFYPQLLTDTSGNIVIKFTVPESTTTWRFMALAHTEKMQFGQIEKSVITNKEFMVSTNLPRFVRTGDHVILQASLNNLSDKNQQGDVYLELFNPSTEAVLSKQNVSFNVPAQENQTVSFEFTAPEDVELLGCRIVATSQQFSDGEQHLLPVVSNATLITQTLPIFTTKKGQDTFSLQLPKGITPYRLTLELTANPIWYAVLALPSMNTPQTDNVTDITASYYVSTLATAIASANPQITEAIKEWSKNPKSTLTSPLEKNQELKSVLLQLSPWMTEAQNESEQMRSLSNLLDINQQNYIYQQAINKLAELQNEDGGWSWFKGFTSSSFMTENVLEAMSRLTTLGATEHSEQVKMMQIKALNFLDKAIQEAFNRKNKAGYAEILYLYTRSAYRDIPLADALAAHKYYLNDLENSWVKLSLYEKALTATTLYRYGKTETAKNIVRSLKEFSTTTPDMGMYWANNRSINYMNSAIQTHVAIMSAFHEINGDTQDTELMKQWLLRQKQTQNWGNAPTTVDAIYALLLTGNNQLAQQENLSVKIGNKTLQATPEESKLGYIKQSFSAKEINAKMTNVTLTKNTTQASWGGLYLQYFEKLDKVIQHSGGISVQKQLFTESDKGYGNTLIPLASQSLKVGDKVNIRITVQIDQDMQFVHLKDLRAGCFEPTEQLSGNRWQDQILFYQETDDVTTNFFFDFLPKGTHVFEYTVWVTQSGTYQDGISTLQCIYAPQYSANSSAGNVTVK